MTRRNGVALVRPKTAMNNATTPALNRFRNNRRNFILLCMIGCGMLLLSMIQMRALLPNFHFWPTHDKDASATILWQQQRREQNISQSLLQEALQQQTQQINNMMEEISKLHEAFLQHQRQHHNDEDDDKDEESANNDDKDDDNDNEKMTKLKEELHDLKKKLEAYTHTDGDAPLDREMWLALRSEPVLFSASTKMEEAPTFRICSEDKGIWGALVLNRLTRLVFPHCHFVFAVDWRLESVASPSSSCELRYVGAYGPRERGHGKASRHIPYFRWNLENSCDGPLSDQDPDPLISVGSRNPHPYCLLVPPLLTPVLNYIGAPHYNDFLQNPANYIPLPEYADSTREKPYFFAYANSNCVAFRDEFFQAVLDRTSEERTHSLFGCLHNHDVELDLPNGHYDVGMFQLYAQYKFVLAMENQKGWEYYITEKILRPLMANSIPVHGGGEDAVVVRQIFNPQRIIFVEDFETVDACIDYLLELDKNDDQYQAILQQPLFANNDGGPHELLNFSSLHYTAFAQQAARQFQKEPLYQDSPLHQCLAKENLEEDDEGDETKDSNEKDEGENDSKDENDAHDTNDDAK